MSEDEFAGANLIAPAAGTLRVTYELAQPRAQLADRREATLPVAASSEASPIESQPVCALEISYEQVDCWQDYDTPLTPTSIGPSFAANERTASAGQAISKTSNPAQLAVPTIRPPIPEDVPTPIRRRRSRFGPIAGLAVSGLIATAAWHFNDGPKSCQLNDLHQIDIASTAAANTMASRIVIVESNGDATAKNKLSSATGAGQFLDGTWLDMIRAYRPGLAEKSDEDILDLRRDPNLSREMVARFAEKNAAFLVRRCLPVTAGTLYLSHFAGGGGAAAVLSAPNTADAATTMADADSTGRATRAMIVTANPFLESFTVADLKAWADRKMGAPDGQRVSRN